MIWNGAFAQIDILRTERAVKEKINTGFLIFISLQSLPDIHFLKFTSCMPGPSSCDFWQIRYAFMLYFLSRFISIPSKTVRPNSVYFNFLLLTISYGAPVHDADLVNQRRYWRARFAAAYEDQQHLGGRPFGYQHKCVQSSDKPGPYHQSSSPP